MVFKGFSKNVLAQLVGPFKYTLRYFPRPFFRTLQIASEKSSLFMLFRRRTFSAICSHRLLQPITHSSSSCRYKISILVSLLLSSFSSAFSNSHPTISASSTIRNKLGCHLPNGKTFKPRKLVQDALGKSGLKAQSELKPT